MSDKNNNELNPLEKQLEDINDWQRNSTNPGHWVGTGRIPLPLKNIIRSPIVMIILGLIILVPIIIGLINNFAIGQLFSSMIALVLGVGFLIGGVMRLMRRK
ncbi:MAG: hypothetical protein RR891_04195 [Clostridium sp.]|uniref:hypothetical protein n=1 Tax=Clostridium sp. TaxID=1506 RepID=UPI00302B2216